MKTILNILLAVIVIALLAALVYFAYVIPSKMIAGETGKTLLAASVTPVEMYPNAAPVPPGFSTPTPHYGTPKDPRDCKGAPCR